MLKLLTVGAVLLTTFKAQAERNMPIILVNDDRRQILIMEFGFAPRGWFNLTIENAKIERADVPVMLYSVRSNQRTPKPLCDNINNEPLDFQSRLQDGRAVHHGQIQANIPSQTFDFHVMTEGFYSTYIAHCHNDTRVTMRVTSTATNPGPNYLSVGEQPLSALFGWFAFFFGGLTALWTYVLHKGTNVMRIHKMMWAVLALKTCVLISESAKYGVGATGNNNDGWTVVYYIFSFLRGSLNVVVLALIGYGWLFIKAFLSKRDKQIVSAIFALQLVSLSFQIVAWETPIGSREWSFAKAAFVILDFLGCMLLLYPIIQTQQSLQKGTEADGKALVNMKRYHLWGRFYLWTVGYVYLTKVLAIFLTEVLTYESVWFSQLCIEVVTMAFYISTGMQFQPIDRNPYFHLTEDEEQATELIVAQSDR